MRNITYLFIGGIILSFLYTLSNFVDSSTPTHVENTTYQQEQRLREGIRRQQDTIQKLRRVIREQQDIIEQRSLTHGYDDDTLSEDVSKIDFVSLYVTNKNLDDVSKERGIAYESYYDPDVDAQYEKFATKMHQIGILQGEIGSETSRKQFAEIHRKAGEAFKRNRKNEVIHDEYIFYYTQPRNPLAKYFGYETLPLLENYDANPLENKSATTGATQVRTVEQVLNNQKYE